MKNKLSLLIILVTLLLAIFACRTVDPEPEEALVEEPPIVEGEMKSSLSKAYPITESVMYSVKAAGDNVMVATLDKDKNIHLLNLAAIEGRLEITGNSSVYSYEKHDRVIHLDLFSTDSAIIISHQEKFYNQVLISYQLTGSSFQTDTLVHTDRPPRIYRHGDYLKLFYNELETGVITFHELDSRDFKGKTISNESKLKSDSFITDFDEKTGRALLLWATEGSRKELYLSIMDENLRGYKPALKLEFDQNIDLPQPLLDKESLSLFFSLDYKNKYIHYELGKVSRDLVELNTTTFDFGEELNINEYLVDRVFKTDQYKAILFKRHNKELKQDESYLAIYSYRYSYYNLLYLKDIRGLTSNYRLISHKDHLYLFWLEEQNKKSRLLYSRIDFITKENNNGPDENPTL